MILLATLGGVVAILALAVLYDIRARRKGVHASINDASRNHLAGCQQGVWSQPNWKDPRR
jgi:hypothetical protein